VSTPRLDAVERPARIAVFRALQLGDMLCVVPALRALRASAPAARITLIGLPSMRDFAARYPAYIDDFVAFPGLSAFPEQPAREDELPAFVDAMRARRFDLVLQLHGDGTILNELLASFDAPLAGFCPVDEAGGHDVARFVPWDEHRSEARRYLDVVERIGGDAAAVADASLELPIRADEVAEWHVVAREHGLVAGRFACVHAGARWPSRRWPVERFAAVAAALARRGLAIVLTGSVDERPIVDALERLLAARGVVAVDLAGRTSLGALAAMLADAALVVCNDTGISHVAAAVHAPSIVVASGSDVARWAPLDIARHPVLAHDVPCRPCMHRVCPIGHDCALGIGVADVVAAADHHRIAVLPVHVHAA
jgi:ADP-heptose:LPS heptosyltransferase